VSFFEKLYRNDELPNRAKLVYIYLYDHRDVNNMAYPGVKRIARELSISEKTARRAIKDLEKAGLVRKEYAYRENGSFTSNRYYLL
jgi:DNA-binding MarR family transcriptional regulator